MKFNPLTFTDLSLFKDWLKRYPQNISELTFTNLFCWNYRNYGYTIYQDHLLIRHLENNIQKYYQPIGPSPEIIINDILSTQPNTQFIRIQENIAKNIKNLQIIEDPDNHDYIYDIADLILLKGQKFASKRNFIKRFKTIEHSLCTIGKKTIKGCLELHETWCNLRDCKNNPSIQKEATAIRTAFTHFDDLGLNGICINIDGNIQAFAFGEKLNKNTYVEHFEKANPAFKGIYQHLLNQFAQSIPDSFTYLNREQDLGIVGLRKAKKSYNPIKMEKKFTITKNTKP